MVNNTTLDDSEAKEICKAIVHGTRKDRIAAQFDTNLVTVERLEIDNALSGSSLIFAEYLQGRSTKVLAKKYKVTQQVVKNIAEFGL